MKCQYIKSDNKQCRAFAQNNKEFCFRHDPLTRQDSLLASKKGGQKRVLQGIYGTNLQLQTSQDARDFVSEVIGKVWLGEVPVPVGSSMGFLIRVWLDCHEASDVEKRLDEIEEKLNHHNP